LGLGGLLDLDSTLESKGGEAKTKGTAKLSKALLIAGGSPAGVPLTVDFNTNTISSKTPASSNLPL